MSSFTSLWHQFHFFWIDLQIWDHVNMICKYEMLMICKYEIVLTTFFHFFMTPISLRNLEFSFVIDKIEYRELRICDLFRVDLAIFFCHQSIPYHRMYYKQYMTWSKNWALCHFGIKHSCVRERTWQINLLCGTPLARCLSSRNVVLQNQFKPTTGLLATPKSLADSVHSAWKLSRAHITAVSLCFGIWGC